jgi:hypothetical protein
MRLQKGEEGNYHHSVHVIEKIEKPEKDENIRRVGLGKEIAFRRGSLGHGETSFISPYSTSASKGEGWEGVS